MNSFPWFWYGLQLFVWLSALCLVFRNGWRQSWGLMLVSGMYLLYNFMVPVSDWYRGIDSYFGYHLEEKPELLSEVGLVYALGAMSLVVSYSVVPHLFRNWFRKPIVFFDELMVDKSLILIVFQCFVWAVIFGNIYASGISIPGLFLWTNQSERDILFSADFFSSGIDLLTNCLPAVLFLLFLSKPRQPVPFVFLFILWLAFSLLAGWRYRIILLLLMFVGWGIRHWNWSPVRMMVVGCILSLSVAWLTLNRMAIAKRQFHLITNDLRQFNIDIFTQELSNSRTFHATLQYLENQKTKHGGIASWLHHVSNKFQPKTSFPGNERPKPWILTVTKAWIPAGWPYNPNPAVTQMEEFYLTFGWVGLLLGMGLMGGLVALFDFRTQSVGIQLFQVIGIALCFQWISRGFFLYQVQISVAVLLPFAVVCLSHAYLRHVRPNKT